jgi:hypothetical protein
MGASSYLRQGLASMAALTQACKAMPNPGLHPIA